MWKEHIALHLHVKNSVQLHQTESWMIIIIAFFFDIAAKKKKAGFLPGKFIRRSNPFHEEKNDQDIILEQCEFWG